MVWQLISNFLCGIYIIPYTLNLNFKPSGIFYDRVRSVFHFMKKKKEKKGVYHIGPTVSGSVSDRSYSVILLNTAS